MTTESSIAAALVDVRKAFRLLHGYHRRMIDTAEVMCAQFSGTEWLRTEYAVELISKHRKPFEDDWAWDALPMQVTNYLLVHHQKPRGWETHHRLGDYLVDLSFIADSGFEDASGEEEPDPTTFTPPEASKSYVRVCIFTPATAQKGRTWLQSWNDQDYPAERTVFSGKKEDYRAAVANIPMQQLTDVPTITAQTQAIRQSLLHELSLPFG